MDIENSILTTATLDATASQQSDLFDASDEDWFRVTLVEGLMYAVEATTPTSDVSPYLRLFSPLQTNLLNAGSASGGSATLRFEAQQNGTHFIGIQDYSGTDFGDYTLSLNANDTISAFFDDALDVAAGSSTTSALDVIGDEDMFVTTLNRGMTYGFSVTTETSDVNPYLSLYNVFTSNFLNAGFDTGQSANLSVTAGASAQFFAKVQDYASDTAGEYTFEINGDDSISAYFDTAEILSSNVPLMSSIDVLQDVDMVQLAITKGLTYSVRVTTDGSDVNPYLRLFNTGESNLANAGFNTGESAVLNFLGAADGTYFASVGDYSSDDHGAYSLELNDDDSIVAGLDTSTTFDSAMDFTSSVDVLSDVDALRFSLTRGLHFEVSVTTDGSDLNPYLQLYNPYGSNVLNAGFASAENARVQQEAAYDGEYVVRISDYSADDIGAYTLSLNDDDTVQSSFATTEVLTSQTPFESHIDVMGDLDMVRVDLNKGLHYQITATAEGSDLNPYLRLFSSFEQNIANAGSTATEQASIVHNAQGDATYYVQVSDYSANDTGAYQLHLDDSDTIVAGFGTQTDVTAGSTLSSALDVRGDVDTVRTMLTEGLTYEFVADAEGSSMSPYLRLFTASGSNLANGGFNGGDVARIRHTAQGDAAYFLQVSAYDGQSTGAYDLSINDNDVIKAGQTTELILGGGQVLQSAIDVFTDVDTVRVNLVAGVTYSYCLSTSDDTLDLYLRLSNENNGTLATAFGDTSGPAMIEFTATQTGTFFLSVSDSSSNGFGDYSLIAFRNLADNVVGTDNGEELHGGKGLDTIIAGGGSDTVGGGDDGDTIDGGAGNDVISGDGGADSLLGGNGNDTVEAGFGADTLKGGNGNDVLRGDQGADSILGGNNNDRLSGGDGNDTLLGGGGGDKIYGGNNNDLMEGGFGNDRLFGGGGEDTLLGGQGNDQTTGGLGQDVFLFDAALFGSDRIRDFQTDLAAGADADQMVFTSAFTEFSDFAGFLAHATQVGAHVVYDLNNDNLNRLQIDNTLLSNLTSADFEFIA